MHANKSGPAQVTGLAQVGEGGDKGEAGTQQQWTNKGESEGRQRRVRARTDYQG